MAFDEKRVNEIFKSEFNQFTFPYDNTIIKFKTYKAFKRFISDEINFWENYDYASFPRFKQLYQMINSKLTEIEKDTPDNATMHFNNIQNDTSNDHFISSDHPLIQFITKLYIENKDKAHSAYRYLILKEQPSMGNRSHFEGLFAACSFKNKVDISASSQFVADKIAEYSAKYSGEIKKISEDYSVIERKYSDELEDLQKSIIDLNDKFNSQFDNQSQAFNDGMANWVKKMDDLEKVYKEHLRLKKPAEYWCDLKTEYNNNGKKWVYASIITGVSLGTLILLVFYNFPGWLKGGFTSDHLKGFLLFALFVSVFTYMIHLFTKLANSSFHLSKDANERLQLTHVYLALLNEKAIEPNEREIVLQALFSRADTGLLKNDGGPTMPGANNILELLTKIKK